MRRLQVSADLLNSRGRSSSQQLTQTCNYCMKPGHIKANCHALKARKDKALRANHKGSLQEEINYVGSSAEVLTNDPNILYIENSIESKVLLTTKDSNTCRLDSSASYHVTPCRLQFKQYWAGHSHSILSRKVAALHYHWNWHSRA